MGDKSRLIQCSEILLRKGHRICGVISSNQSILHWAREKNLRHISPDSDIIGPLKEEPFDIFFSIDNLHKVPNEILTLPRIYPVNFHDGPLPRYAGNNATNWALMNREEMHGITWHVMTNVIDAGDILKQKVFSISDDETALTLNAKCYEKSIESFDELIDEIAERRATLTRQSLNERTFFPLWKRPPVACIIDWSRPAAEIEALCRGLDFGSYPNPLGLPKLFLGEEIIIVRQIRLLESKSAAPGTITLVTDEEVHVATGSQDLALRNFVTMNGKAVSPAEFLGNAGLREGSSLPTLPKDCADTVSKVISTYCKHEEYWTGRLANLAPVEVPYTRKSNLADGKPRYVGARFSPPLRMSANGGISDNYGDLLLTAFMLFFSRIGGERSFDINYRDATLQEGLSDTEFLFASHVPLRIDIDYEQRFEQLHKDVGEKIRSSRSHGSYARDLVLRDPGLRNKFGGVFNERVPIAIDRQKTVSEVRERCDADLLIAIPDDGKELLWLYDEQVLDRTNIDRMWTQFEVLLNDIALGSDRPIGQLSILPEEERRKLVLEWNDTKRTYPQGVCLHELFEAQVERTPDNVALACDGKQLTYRELNHRANQLGHYLRKAGIGPDRLVGVFMERSLEMVVAIYGIIKAGGAYVPLDPEYPQDRVAFMAKDTAIPVLLTQKHLEERLPHTESRVVCLDSEWTTIAQERTGNISNGATSENLAYVIYTSGSTGLPKGVLNIHRGICNRLIWMQEAYRMTESEHVLQKTPFSFDVSVWEFFWPLQVGARLIMARPGGHKDSNYLVKLIQEEGITTLHFVPSMLEVFLNDPDVRQCSSLKRVICSGEALPYELQERFFENLNAELHNLYGPTEAAVDVTYWACKRHSARRIVPIGYPVANTQLYVLDAHLQPVPIGVIGELYIGGVQVARGYLNRPELSSEKFIRDPFSKSEGARLYRTGDVARYLPDGAIEYLGRTDHQVKIRGMRIELGEIESVLEQHASVRQAVIMAREDAPGNKQLVAYIVPQAGQSLSISELRRYLKVKLPEYMMPSAFVELERFPLSPNGKIDRKVLPAPTNVHPYRESDYVAPQTDMEQIISDIWQGVLHVEKIGVKDNFFDLGGHSLRLAQVQNRLREQLQRNVSILDLFKFPTVQSLADYLTQGGEKEQSSERRDDRYEKLKEGKSRLKQRFKQKEQVTQKSKGLQYE